MREHLLRIGQQYKTAKNASFTGHALASYIRHDAAQALRDALEEEYPDLLFKCSAGQGDWADVPWLGIFDPAITPAKAEDGYYIVYLFHASDDLVYLSLNQGTTKVKKEFGRGHKDVLRERASLMRHRLHEYVRAFDVHTINLGSNGLLPSGYQAGHAIGKLYDINALPPDDVLIKDLQDLARAYRVLTTRGGVADASADGTAYLKALPGMQETPAQWIQETGENTTRVEGTSTGGGQGYGLAPKERVAVEQHAMLSARRYLEAEGFSVEDVSRTHSYDFIATKNGDAYIIEVKGTTSTAGSIFLTFNEIEAHKLKYPRNMLIVVHSIELDKTTDPPKADGGVRIVKSPWKIEEEFLRPITFQYSPTSGF